MLWFGLVLTELPLKSLILEFKGLGDRGKLGLAGVGGCNSVNRQQGCERDGVGTGLVRVLWGKVEARGRVAPFSFFLSPFGGIFEGTKHKQVVRALKCLSQLESSAKSMRVLRASRRKTAKRSIRHQVGHCPLMSGADLAARWSCMYVAHEFYLDCH